MNLFSGVVAWVVFCFWMGVLFNGCAGQGKQETWERCSSIHHKECRDLYDTDPYYQYEDYQDCEYEYYKECIGE